MTGRPLKHPEQRRNRTPPGQGEWIELPATLDTPILPAYQAHFTIPQRYWDGWRSDPLTTQYNEADLVAIGYLATEWVDMEHNERRMAMDRLGLNPKARRDLRWRTPREAEQQREAVAKVRKLRVVGAQAQKEQPSADV